MPDDEWTPILCRNCGGNGCRFCTDGWMSPEDLGRWMRAQSGQRPAAQERKATQPFDPHRIVILERLAKAWEKQPDMRLGQLLIEALAYQHITPETLRTLDDRRLCELVEHFVLLGSVDV
jgi:hypothetical protein